jgi:peptidoglycan/LPS O-acetylase OafA/YrhL
MNSRQQGIDALRGMAVLMVVFFHSHVPWFREFGVLGVDLFFVLSGYCIHRGYAAHPERFDTRNYLLRRWWRIYPPYFFALSLAVILNLTTNGIKWQTGGEISWYQFGPLPILSHLFMVHDLSRQTMLTVSGPFWTVAMEMQYYLLYWILRPLFNSGKGWFVLWVSALLLYGVAWHFYYSSSGVQLLNPFCYWVEWVLGAYLAQLSVRMKNFNSGRNAVLAALVFSALTVLYVGSFIKDPQMARLVVAGALFALTAWALMTEALWRSRIISWLPKIGLFSYSVYLTHFLILDRIHTFVVPILPSGVLRAGVSLSAVLFSLGFAYVFYLYFEKPFHDRSVRVRNDAISR